MLLHFSDQREFATGAARYQYGPASLRENTIRILVRVSFENIFTEAVLDTGAPYVVCAQWLARALKLDPSTALDHIRILIRGSLVSGKLFRMSLTFPTEHGMNLALDATVFAPDAPGQDDDAIPPFIGLAGCLERMRFAIDPSEDMFYFGALSQE